MTVTCVIPCKGRCRFIEQAVSSLLRQIEVDDYRVLVVDYGCPDGVWSWCQENGSYRLDCVRILDRHDEFNLARARNCGNRLVETEMIVALDSDCILKDPQVLSRIIKPVAAEERIFCLVSVGQEDGTVHPGQSYMAYRRADWLAVRGYDEQMVGWGYEDTDFYMRLQAHGKCQLVQTDAREFKLIGHGDEQRVQFYPEKDISKSWERNCDHAHTRAGVNLHGFALFDYEFYHGDSGMVESGSFTLPPD